uniref:protein-tyrosine-phosphatase n=1 Tax=Cacopsylla melanoneura TaxID=428564 RepID=A0A8D8UCD9_9HEMI
MFRCFINMIALVFVCLCSMSLTTGQPKRILNEALPCPRNLTVEDINTTTILISWIPPDQFGGNEFYIFNNYYIFRYKTNKDMKWMKNFTSETKLMLTTLLPGENYTIEVSSLFYGKYNKMTYLSPNTSITYVTLPEAVRNVDVLPSEGAITLKFPKPSGWFDSFNLKTNCTTLSNNGNGEELWGSCKIPIRQEIDRTECEHIDVNFDYRRGFYIFHINAVKWSVTCEFIIRSVSYNKRSNKTVVLGTTVSDKLFDVPSYLTHSVKGQIKTEESVDDTPTIRPRETRSESDENSFPSIAEISIKEVTSSSVTLSWKHQDIESKFKFSGSIKPEQIFTYIITYDNNTIETNNVTVNITGLVPYHNYTFSMTAISNTVRTKPLNTTVQTLESIPGNFSIFKPDDINPTNISFVWSLPDEEKHGVITEFIIFFEHGDMSDKERFNPNVKRGTVPRLIHNTEYLFKLHAYTKVGKNNAIAYKQRTPQDRPPKPLPFAVPMVTTTTTSTIQVRLNKNFFSELNGPIMFYTVIVAEQTDDIPSVENENSLPNWNDVQSKSPWPPYQVFNPKQIFTDSPVVEYTIGEEKCPNGVLYCNGPLKSGTSYRVKLRAFTTPTMFTDTSYSECIDTTNNSSLFIVLCLVLVIVFIIFLGILKQYLYGQSSIMSNNLPLQNFSLPILIEHFKTMIINRDRMLEEFESLKRVGVNQSTEEGELDCNRPKNRFSNILPYDNSRYKLQPVDDEEGSDYVNASYVPGHLSPRQYIATQGPLAGTCEEFWRLCWESKTPAIVMLTQCVELGRDKCHRYWPIGVGTMQYGALTVCLTEVTHYTGWSLSELVLYRGEKQRTVFHFHFTSWPDHGVPQTRDTLARFVFEFRARIKPDQNPVVVHCSAGVGRTGTFIAIDTVLQQLDKLGDAGSVDILGMVYGLRKARKQMVQTVEQYEYIYQSVQLVLQGLNYTPDTPLKQSEPCEQDEGVDDL